MAHLACVRKLNCGGMSVTVAEEGWRHSGRRRAYGEGGASVRLEVDVMEVGGGRVEKMP
jgi:hypothetical protein